MREGAPAPYGYTQRMQRSWEFAMVTLPLSKPKQDQLRSKPKSQKAHIEAKRSYLMASGSYTAERHTESMLTS
jgi:hypothetical protein